VTVVANLRHDVKNIPLVLRAAKRIVVGYDRAHFVIAGEGELEPELRSLASALEITDRVHFVGRCDDVPTLLALSYAGVLSSTAEGFSNSILEYMAAGLPVIATNVGGAAEAVVDGVSGFLIESDDDEDLARRLSDILENEEKASVMGLAGRNIALEKFSADEQFRKTVRLYDSLLG
jgi:glycosyltransferase involved in cell wall biosynthesis